MVQDIQPRLPRPPLWRSSKQSLPVSAAKGGIEKLAKNELKKICIKGTAWAVEKRIRQH